MSEANEFRAALYAEVIVFMRQRHPDLIDAAYEYFWEEEYPEDFLSGLPLELGFINFEDWFICDYRIPEDDAGRGITDLYLEESGQKGDGEKSAALLALKRSFISLYEAKPGADDGALVLEDVLSGRTHSFGRVPFDGLKDGSLFAARVLEFAGRGNVMGACIYPFAASMRQAVLDSVGRQLARYKKNKNPEGTLQDFLKDESYTFNTIWTNSLYSRS
ncbi:MAG: hypothetical protein M0Z58_05160 [Nitrospiraceae bacterium]|nr:hypothetical protein [Nitrospiraceae bacterium]